MKAFKNSSGLGRRLMVSLGILGAAGAVAGLGTWATFTDSTTANHSISTGTVDINLGTANSAANRFTDSATDVAAGDTIQRAVNLAIAGSLDLSAVTLGVTGGTTGLNNATDGLNLQVEECPTAWNETATAGPVYTYTCTGGLETDALADGDILTGGALSLSSLAPGTKYLRFTWRLPSTADQDATTNGKQSGETGVYTYAFAGTQRAGTNR